MNDPVGTDAQEQALREATDRFVRCAVAIGGLYDGRHIAETVITAAFNRLEYEREQRRNPRTDVCICADMGAGPGQRHTLCGMHS